MREGLKLITCLGGTVSVCLPEVSGTYFGVSLTSLKNVDILQNNGTRGYFLLERR